MRSDLVAFLVKLAVRAARDLRRDGFDVEV